MEEAAPAEAPPPPPVEEPMMAPAEMPAPADAATVPPQAESPVAEEEAEGGVPGWFRMDTDLLSLQFWFGATHDVGGVGIATDIYVDSAYLAEFDIGIEVPIGDPVLLIPMVGVAFDWSQMRPTTLVAPQLFGYFDFSPVYIEWWSQFFLNSVFGDEDLALGTVDDDGNLVADPDTVQATGNTWYNRLFVLFNVTENLSIGPQIEATIGLNDAGKIPDEDGELKALTSMPVGGQVSLGYGENNTLGLFLGYETVKEARTVYYDFGADDPLSEEKEQGIVGRFTFVRTW